MTGASTHISLTLAWAVANTCAVRAGREAIQPADFLLAALIIIDGLFHADARRLGITDTLVHEVESHAADARKLVSLDDTTLTRVRREAMASNSRSASPAHRMLHRSEASRELFGRAAAFATADGAEAISIVHLVKALMLTPSTEIRDVLTRGLGGKAAPPWETRITRFANQFHPARCTLVFTDIEGSMAIKRAFGDGESARLFRAHDNLVREYFSRYADAREIKTIGDAFLIAFEHESSAVCFGLGLQAALRVDLRLSRVPIRVRIGIHSGTLLARDPGCSDAADPIFGIAIDATSRIASLAVGSQILVSSEVRERARSAIEASPPEGLGSIRWVAHGLYRLKGLDQPIEIHEVGEDGRAPFTRPEGVDKATPVPMTSTHAPRVALRRVETATPRIDALGRDLTELARQGALAPVVGRRAEMTMLARHLIRTSKRNVIVVGDPGVGKSALIEGLAQIAIRPDAPKLLRNLRFVQINVADLVAGTRYRGDAEARVQGLIAEADADPNLVLFLDEIHLVMGAGAASGSGMDVANMLKPALTGNQIRCVGATTTDEFERHVKKDAAFMRRFQILRIPEPTNEEATAICRDWAQRLSRAQSVDIAPEAVAAAVSLASRLIRNRCLPDKAIDLLENAAALVRLSSLSVSGEGSTWYGGVTVADVETVLREQYGIEPNAAGVMDPDEVRVRLDSQLVGQDAAIRAIVDAVAVLRSRGLADRRPLGVLLLTGPTGVGKTTAALCLGEALFGDADRHVGRFNMNEYKDRHELARLIGAPPGFIGHDQQGALFQFVERSPQGVILLDEIEKAHPEIRDYFLQIFDTGETRDPRGRVVDFKRHLFVLTSNVVLNSAPTPAGIGSGTGDTFDRALVGNFRREFLGRIDRIVPFQQIGRQHHDALFDRLVHALAERVAESNGIELHVDAVFRRSFCAGIGDLAEGGRAFSRRFDQALTAPVMSYLAGLGDVPGGQLVVDESGVRYTYSSL